MHLRSYMVSGYCELLYLHGLGFKVYVVYMCVHAELLNHPRSGIQCVILYSRPADHMLSQWLHVDLGRA